MLHFPMIGRHVSRQYEDAFDTSGQNKETNIIPCEEHDISVDASSHPLIAPAGFQLWLPGGLDRVRCVLLVNQRGAGERLYHDEEWRTMARDLHAAMLYCRFETPEVCSNGYGEAILQACRQAVDKTGLAELGEAPFVAWGHSMGGRVAQDFARYVPHRLVAYVIACRAESSSPEFMQEKPEDRRIPALYLMGSEDAQPPDIFEHFLRARAGNSPRTWLLLPGQGHWPKGMDFTRDETSSADWRAWAGLDLLLPWIEALAEMRLPSLVNPQHGSIGLRTINVPGGWLGEIHTGQIAPYARFSGDRTRAAWLPNQHVAEAWARCHAQGSSSVEP